MDFKKLLQGKNLKRLSKPRESLLNLFYNGKSLLKKPLIRKSPLENIDKANTLAEILEKGRLYYKIFFQIHLQQLQQTKGKMTINKTNNVYEIGLNEKDSNIWLRTFKSFKNYLLPLSITLVIAIILKGYNVYYLLSYVLGLSLFFIYCLTINRKILFKVRYYVESDEIELVSVRYNQTNVELITKRDTVQILVRQNFSYRYTVWRIAFYHNKKLIISQNEFSGWSKEMFLRVEKDFKKSS